MELSTFKIGSMNVINPTGLSISIKAILTSPRYAGIAVLGGSLYLAGVTSLRRIPADSGTEL